MDAEFISPSEHGPPLVATSDLIGRRTEWQQLQAVWHRAAGGHSHLVVLTGDAGIGKSRLAEELLEWAGQQGIATATHSCLCRRGAIGVCTGDRLVAQQHVAVRSVATGKKSGSVK